MVTLIWIFVFTALIAVSLERPARSSSDDDRKP